MSQDRVAIVMRRKRGLKVSKILAEAEPTERRSSRA
jgi:hypothetical protein